MAAVRFRWLTLALTLAAAGPAVGQAFHYPLPPLPEAKEEGTYKVYNLRDLGLLGDGDKDVQTLADTLPRVIRPGSWSTPPACLQGKVLVVYQTPQVIAEVDAFFQKLQNALVDKPEVNDRVPNELTRVTQPPYTIEPPDVLTIHAGNLVPLPPHKVDLAQSNQTLQQIRGEHLVRSDGTIGLGVYGHVFVDGMTVEIAKAVIEKHLSQYLVDPKISLDISSCNSKFYYVIFELAGKGQRIVRLRITGKETVLDAIANACGLTPISTHRIWVARPGHGSEPELTMKVDWKAITQQGKGETNYELTAGDRVYVTDEPAAPSERSGPISSSGNGNLRSEGELPILVKHDKPFAPFHDPIRGQHVIYKTPGYQIDKGSDLFPGEPNPMAPGFINLPNPSDSVNGGLVAVRNESQMTDADTTKAKLHILLAQANCLAKTARDANKQEERTALWDKARGTFEQVLELDPKNLQALRGLTEAFVKSGDKDRALATIDRALDLAPNDPNLLSDQATVFACRREWKKAETALFKALLSSPDNRQVKKQLGMILARQGQFEQGFDYLSQSGGPAYAHYIIARILSADIGQVEACKQRLRQAIEANPDHRQAREMLERLEDGRK